MKTEDLGKVETINRSLLITAMEKNSRASFKN